MSIERTRAASDQTIGDVEEIVEKLADRVIAKLDVVAHPRPYLTSVECADLIGITPQHLCSMRAHKEGPPWSGNGRWIRFERNAVLNWLAALPVEPSHLSGIPNTEKAQSND